MCGADCWTDHRLIISKLNIKVQPPRRPQGTKTPKRLNVAKLKNDSVKQCFTEAVNNKLDSLTLGSDDLEAEWALFRDTIHASALETIGPTTRKHQDWFDENNDSIKQLLELKHQPHRALINDPTSISKKVAFNNIKRKVQQDLRQMQDVWLSAKADEIQSYAYADRHDSKNFYAALKAVYGPTASGSSPLLSADGNNLIADKEKILERWAEHFKGVLNKPSAINDSAIARLPQIPLNDSLADIPNEAEVLKAIKLLVQWQSSWGRFHSSRSVCSRWGAPGNKTHRAIPVHVEPGKNSTGVQGCLNCPSLQAQRQSSGL